MGDALPAPSPAELYRSPPPPNTLTPITPQHSPHRTAIRPKKISPTTMLTHTKLSPVPKQTKPLIPKLTKQLNN